MKSLLLALLIAAGTTSVAQKLQNPVITSAGGIYDIPAATVKPDPALEYKVVIDVATGPEKPSDINPSLDNVARLMNLHAIGGVDSSRLTIVLAVHNVSAFSVMNNEAYRKKFKTDNPNLKLIEELTKAGVKIAICGQSMMKREIEPAHLAPGVEVATSMLTTVTTYQLRGYAYLKF